MAQNLNKRALLVNSDEGWQGLWIDKKLVKQYYSLEEGMDRGLLFMAISIKYKLKIFDFQTAYANEKAEPYLEEGQYPETYEDIIKVVDFEEPFELDYVLSFLE